MESVRHDDGMARHVDGLCVAEDAGSIPQLQLEAGRLRGELAPERELSLRAVADFDNYRRRVTIVYKDHPTARCPTPGVSPH